MNGGECEVRGEKSRLIWTKSVILRNKTHIYSKILEKLGFRILSVREKETKG